MRLKTFSVSELNNYIGRLMKVDPVLGAVRVSGELSSFKAHTSGHAYFTLKDADSRIQCVMFSSHFQRLGFRPQDGMQVELFGRVGVYGKSGQYQVYVSEMLTGGTGDLHLRFQALKEQLEKEGLFDAAHKKPLAAFPKRIAVITSPTSAALRDVLSVLGRRNPAAEILIVPSTMQGDRTVEEVCRAFDLLKARNDLDLVILTRGGGSYEELFNFNDERIARRIHDCPIPVISAIGHEIDFTIADFVADQRAATPSAAAELASADLGSLYVKTRQLMAEMVRRTEGRIERIEQVLERRHPSRMVFDIEKRLVDSEHELAQYRQKISHRMDRMLDGHRHRLDLLIGQIDARNPLQLLSRGFSRTTDAEGHSIRSVTAVEAGQTLITQLKDGRVVSTVTGKEPRSHEDQS